MEDSGVCFVGPLRSLRAGCARAHVQKLNGCCVEVRCPCCVWCAEGWGASIALRPSRQGPDPDLSQGGQTNSVRSNHAVFFVRRRFSLQVFFQDVLGRRFSLLKTRRAPATAREGSSKGPLVRQRIQRAARARRGHGLQKLTTRASASRKVAFLSTPRPQACADRHRRSDGGRTQVQPRSSP